MFFNTVDIVCLWRDVWSHATW